MTIMLEVLMITLCMMSIFFTAYTLFEDQIQKIADTWAETKKKKIIEKEYESDHKKKSHNYESEYEAFSNEWIEDLHKKLKQMPTDAYLYLYYLMGKELDKKKG